MLQYKNHRFHCSGISFEIPNGYFVDDNTSGDNSLGLYSTDRSLHVYIGVYDSGNDARTELERICKNESVDSFAPVSINGLEGFMASFRIRREIQYYEVMLDLSDGCVLNLTFADHGNKTHSNTESLIETLNILRENENVEMKA